MFHSTNPSLFGRPAGATALIGELTLTVDGLRDLSNSLIADDSDATAGASRMLSDFEGQLSAYFDAEESSDYFATLGEPNEAFRSRADVLQRTHDSLRVTVASLGHLVRSAVAADTYDLGRRIGGVIDELGRYQGAEAKLLQDFFRHDSVRPVVGGVQ